MDSRIADLKRLIIESNQLTKEVKEQYSAYLYTCANNLVQYAKNFTRMESLAKGIAFWAAAPRWKKFAFSYLDRRRLKIQKSLYDSCRVVNDICTAMMIPEIFDLTIIDTDRRVSMGQLSYFLFPHGPSEVNT